MKRDRAGNSTCIIVTSAFRLVFKRLQTHFSATVTVLTNIGGTRRQSITPFTPIWRYAKLRVKTMFRPATLSTTRIKLGRTSASTCLKTKRQTRLLYGISSRVCAGGCEANANFNIAIQALNPDPNEVHFLRRIVSVGQQTSSPALRLPLQL